MPDTFFSFEIRFCSPEAYFSVLIGKVVVLSFAWMEAPQSAILVCEVGGEGAVSGVAHHRV